MSPTAGRDYPRSYAQLRRCLDEDWKCLVYLDWLRWPDGFVFTRCGSNHGWRTRPASPPAHGLRSSPPSLDVGRPQLPWRGPHPT